MASLVIKNGYLALGGTEISQYSKGFTLQAETDAVDDTTMGDETKSNTPGLYNWNLSVDPRADYADNLLDEILWNLRGTTFTVAVRPVNAAISASNPEYQMNGMLSSVQIIGGSVGDLAMQPFTIVPSKGSGSSTIVRDITP